MYLKLLRELNKGKSLYRALTDLYLVNHRIEGSIIDIGSKEGTSSYYGYLNINKESNITFVDYYASSKSVIKLDLEEDLPIKSKTYDVVLAMNVFEHIYRYEGTISECFRILKTDGKILGCVPFLYKYHPDPYDFHRFTESCLRKRLSESGFCEVIVEPLSLGPFTSGTSIFFGYLKFRFIKFLVFSSACCLDLIIRSFFGSQSQRVFPLGYIFYAKKCD